MSAAQLGMLVFLGLSFILLFGVSVILTLNHRPSSPRFRPRNPAPRRFGGG